jgi:hypothetical protein
MSRLSRFESVTWCQRTFREVDKHNLEAVKYLPFSKEALHHTIAIKEVTRRRKLGPLSHGNE